MYTLIVNPISGGGKALATLPKAEAELKARGIEYRVLYTELPITKELFASVPCGHDDTVIIIGGDGTIFDALNSLSEHDMVIMYVPCGTGNDFVKTLHLPSDPIKALRLQLDGKPRPIDFVKANEMCFMNVCGTGFDVEVLKKLGAFRKKFTGLKAYLMALIQALKEYKPISCEISVDGGKYERKKLCIVSIGNGKYFGGGMKAVPDAEPFDGLLDVVEVAPVKRWQVIFMLPKFISGRHTKLKFAKTYKCRSFDIRGSELTIQMDGELRKMSKLSLSVISNKLRFSM